MKHAWQDVDEGWQGLMRDRLRRCTKCGKEQRRTVRYFWMRVDGYRWMPLAGRCTGKKSGKTLREVFADEE